MRYRGYLFDLDGTLFRGNEPILPAVEAVKRLHRQGAVVRYVTNNSTQTRRHFAEKLTKMGYRCAPSDVVSSAVGTARYLREHSIRSAYVVGEAGLVATLNEFGVETVYEGELAESVVVGLCRHFTYDMLKEAMDQIRSGAKFIATNPDTTYPMEGGRLIPGAGSLVASVRAASGVEPVTIGKPSPFLIECALQEAALSPAETLVVGDRIDTDIESGRRAGCDTFLVLTGVERTLPEGQRGAPDLSRLGIEW